MKRLLVFLVVVLAALNLSEVYASTVVVNTSGVSDYKTEYFYKNSIDLVVKDYTPSKSDSFYLAISYDGTTYSRLTENTYYGEKRPSKLSFKFEADTVLNNIKIGLFQNPNNVWEVKPIDSIIFNTILPRVECIYSKNQFSKGNYSVLVRQLITPDQDSLDYFNSVTRVFNLYYKTLVSGNNNVNSDVVKYIKNVTLDSFIVSNVHDYSFIIKTLDNKYSIYNSGNIEVKDSLHYLNILTLGGLKQINDQVELNWETSGFYSNYNIKILLNNSKVKEDTIHSKKYSMNFKDYGFYTFIVSASNEAFSLTDSVSFYVVDPCSVEKDSIILLNNRISIYVKALDSLTILSKSIKDSLDITKLVNSNLSLEIVRLNNFIKDSTVYRVILSDKVTSVLEVNSKDLKSQVVIKDLDLKADNVTIWLYNSNLQLLESNYFLTINKYDLSSNPEGVYYLVVKGFSDYYLIKVIKTN